MTTAPPGERSEDVELNQPAALIERIGQQVLRALGRPPRLIRVQVRSLWGKYYRANVFVGADATGATIGHSYFVEAEDDGTMIGSTPRITKVY